MNSAHPAQNGNSPRPPGLTRKSSSPLMPAYMVSAPGKVIVYGEHAVVHGKAAIAAAISLRSYLLVTFLSKSRRTVSLRFPDINLDHTWNIDDLPWAAFSDPTKKKYYYDLVTSLDEDLVEAIQPHITCVSPHIPEQQRRIHQNSAAAFLYLFLSLGSQKSPPCVYTLRSTIPIGAGLGSSATIAVCLSAALLLQIRALSGPHTDQPPDESALQIERINRWAFVGEMCIHGNPSGVDNTVSSGGKAVYFKREDYSKPPIVKALRDFPELPLLLVNTRQQRSTAVEVAKVGALKKAHPRVAELLLSAINDVTESAHSLISAEDFDPDDPAALKYLGELITINHGLLVSLGVSHPKLERIRALIDHAGIGYTKLTGAGGGGCAITILKPEAIAHPTDTTNGHQTNGANGHTPKGKSPILQDLERKLDAEGFEKFETTLAGDGVGVLWPAVLQNGSGEEGGEEIDQEKFLNAEGDKGIEALVGVAVSRREEEGEVREGWKFWRP
ncbi:mevalonate kinase [Patellaria atrata CBS 101060]|uniref:Mevalonate kinase n=1 Tax=Patellaria atrata CBS 101060 TaxID=1346257 RepID=A0A9P4SHN3_9PEZI|nr:mevalonate kinase [Patellaria atrata CBS 101060]